MDIAPNLAEEGLQYRRHTEGVSGDEGTEQTPARQQETGQHLYFQLIFQCLRILAPTSVQRRHIQSRALDS